MVCSWWLNSAAPCEIQPSMFEVQVMSASPSQKPIVSPNQRAMSGPRRGTAHVEHEVARDHEVHRMAAVLREAPHEAFRPAVATGPLRIVGGIVIHLLYEALLVLR